MSTSSARELAARLRNAAKHTNPMVNVLIAHETAEAIALELERLADLEAAEKRGEWREGFVTVIDHEGKFLGCMGTNTWARLGELSDGA